MLIAENIKKSYRGNPVLNGINLTVHAGETVCIIGKNGSGKSTLLQILASILTPDKGSVTVDNQNITKNPKAAKHTIGFIPQDDALLKRLTVLDNLSFFAALYGVGKEELFAKGRIADVVALAPYQKKKAGELSGGQRKRLHIACSLLHDPPVLLMDEPFSGLDMIVKSELLDYLQLLRSKGKTIIYTSHGTQELYALCDRAYLLSGLGLLDVTTTLKDGKGDISKQLVTLIRKGQDEELPV